VKHTDDPARRGRLIELDVNLSRAFGRMCGASEAGAVATSLAIEESQRILGADAGRYGLPRREMVLRFPTIVISSGTNASFLNLRWWGVLTMRRSDGWPRAIVILLLAMLAVRTMVARKGPSPASASARQQPAVSLGQALTPAGLAELHSIADSARHPDLRWPDFTPYTRQRSINSMRARVTLSVGFRMAASIHRR
jgi:hypothetical protein